MKTNLLSILFVLMFGFSAVAQPPNFVISGTVTNNSNGNPIPNHTVTAFADSTVYPYFGYNATTTTNSSGQYTFTVPNVCIAGRNHVFTLSTYDCLQQLATQTAQTMQGTSCSSTNNFSICVSNTPPNCQASFSYATSGSGVYTFNGSSNLSSPVSYSWNFGNNLTSNVQNPVVTLPNGTYNVCLTIFNTLGCQSTFCQTVVVNNTTPGCQASFTYTNTTSGVYTFSGSNNSTSPVSYSWNFGNGTTSTLQNPVVTLTSGTYNVCLITNTSNGCMDTTCQSIVVNNNTGTCPVSFTITYGPSGRVTFGNSSNINFSSLLWDFGNGVTSTVQNPTYTYTANGTYNVCLTLTTPSGCQNTTCQTVTVTNASTTNNCSAQFTYALNPSGGYTFTPAQTTNGTSYSWNFGNGTTSTQPNPSITFPNNGSYSVCLTVSVPNLGTVCTQTWCDSVYVNNNPGACQASFTYTIGNNGTVTFQSTSNIVVSSFSWNFGNGSSTTLQNPTHTYTANGSYQVCLTIATPNGCTNTTCQNISITNIGTTNNCNSQFTYTVNNNGTFTFMPSITPTNMHTYTWSFGDGSSGTGSPVSHNYANYGSYIVCLTVANVNGTCSQTSCDTIVWASTNPCIANFVYSINPSGVVSFYDTSSSMLPVTYQWNFGDGTTSNLANPTHTFQNGTYNVCLVIFNSSGCQASHCETIVIGNSNNCQASFTYTQSVSGAYIFSGSSNVPNTPMTYSWNFGNGIVSNLQYPTVQFTSFGTYQVCLTISNNQGCSNTHCQTITFGNTTGTYQISGRISRGTPNFPAANARVFLIKFNPATNMLTAVAGVGTDSLGNYTFNNVAPGDYRVKAALTPNSPYYNNFMPTYYGNSLFWNFAIVFPVTNSSISGIDISLIGGNNPGGPGFVGGNVTQGANKVAGPGDPISDVEVLLLDMNDNPVGYAYSDAAGAFSFSGLAYGTYKVYAEVAGLPTTPAIVTVSADEPSLGGVSILINSADVTVSFEEIKELNGFYISKISPNPAREAIAFDVNLEKNESMIIQIFSAQGQLVATQSINAFSGKTRVNIPLETLPAGFYNLNISGDNLKLNKTFRFIKTE